MSTGYAPVGQSSGGKTYEVATAVAAADSDHDEQHPASSSPGSASTPSHARIRTPPSNSGDEDDSEDDDDVAPDDEDMERSFRLQRLSKKGRRGDVNYEKRASWNRRKGRLGVEAVEGEDGEGDDEDEGYGEGDDEEEYGGRRKSGDTTHSFMLYTPDQERGVVRRLDKKLTLFVAFLYMLSFLDRSNIGNAKIAGLKTDLNLTSSQYEWLLTAFYISYILFQWMNLLYRVIPPHIYISLCVLSWGLLASLQSIATSFTTLVLLRFLLGVGEAAFSPGIPFYLSFFYKRSELALRVGLFISAAPLATSFAGSLAWAITKLGSNGPIAPWRLLFLVEGFPSVFIAVIAWHLIPDSPAAAKFLTKAERRIAKLRLRRERGSKEGEKRGLKWREIGQALLDPKCYITAAMLFSCNVAFSSLPVFLPTIINEMGYTALHSQALSAPPYLFAFVVVLVVAFLSDRHASRTPYVCFGALLSTAGYAIMAISGKLRLSPLWRYSGSYLAAAGFFTCVTLIITWTINNQQTESKKGTSMSLLNVIGQFGPLLGTRLYPEKDGPYYVKGMSICALFMFAVFGLSLFYRFVLSRENGKLEAVWLEGSYARVGVGEDEHEGGVREKSQKKAFRYML